MNGRKKYCTVVSYMISLSNKTWAACALQDQYEERDQPIGIA
jgi:hypothetical protein